MTKFTVDFPDETDPTTMITETFEMLDEAALVWPELILIQKVTGEAITALSDDDEPSAAQLAGLLFVSMKRSKRGFSWSDFAAIPLSRFDIGVDDPAEIKLPLDGEKGEIDGPGEIPLEDDSIGSGAAI